tara:strand:+ start:4718 stop:5047 length:330 start_codon:yes stop_codon:yes gene_type:complete
MGDDSKYTISIAGSEYSTIVDPKFDTTYVLDSNISTCTVDLDTLQNEPYVFEDVVFADTLPDIHRVHEMCKLYPALNKAYEQFKLIYKMTEQDYNGKLKEEGFDDDVPF